VALRTELLSNSKPMEANSTQKIAKTAPLVALAIPV